MIAAIEIIVIATAPDKVADDFDAPRLFAMPIAIATGMVQSDVSAIIKSAVMASASPYVMIGIMTAGMTALRPFLNITVEVRAIENIGPTAIASETVEPVSDITNDAITARIARIKNLFMQIAVQNAQIMQIIRLTSSADADCKSVADVMSEQMTAAPPIRIDGEAGEEKNPLLATLIFSF